MPRYVSGLPVHGSYQVGPVPLLRLLVSMAPESSPRLPLELCYHIITFLQNDSSILVNCSLVCHAWLFATRPHIFRTLVIESERKYRRTLRILIDHPHLSRYVHELRIVGTMLVAYRAFGELLAVAPSLPHLEHLCLQCWAFLDHHTAPRSLPYSPLGSVLGALANIRELALHMIFPRPLDFIQLIRACPNLRALHLSVMLLFVDHHDIPQGAVIAPPPETMSLETLIWRKSTLFALRWLRDHPRFSPRTMSLAWSEESAIGHAPYQQEMTTVVEIVQEALRKTGPTLERLELCADHGRDQELVDYGLSHCVSLRGIKLETSYRNRSPGSRGLPRIVHAIRQLNSPALSSIEVGLGWDKFVDFALRSRAANRSGRCPRASGPGQTGGYHRLVDMDLVRQTGRQHHLRPPKITGY